MNSASETNWQRLLVVLALSLAMTSCANTSEEQAEYVQALKPSTYTRTLIDHEKPGWDPLQIWRRLGNSKPAIFVPADMPRSVPVNEKHGTWTVDVADGARFFVPNGGTRRFAEPILKVEAHKATNHISRRKSAARNTAGVVVLWPVASAIVAAGSVLKATNMPQ